MTFARCPSDMTCWDRAAPTPHPLLHPLLHPRLGPTPPPSPPYLSYRARRHARCGAAFPDFPVHSAKPRPYSAWSTTTTATYYMPRSSCPHAAPAPLRCGPVVRPTSLSKKLLHTRPVSPSNSACTLHREPCMPVKRAMLRALCLRPT